MTTPLKRRKTDTPEEPKTFVEKLKGISFEAKVTIFSTLIAVIRLISGWVSTAIAQRERLTKLETTVSNLDKSINLLMTYHFQTKSEVNDLNKKSTDIEKKANSIKKVVSEVAKEHKEEKIKKEEASGPAELKIFQ